MPKATHFRSGFKPVFRLQDPCSFSVPRRVSCEQVPLLPEWQSLVFLMPSGPTSSPITQRALLVVWGDRTHGQRVALCPQLLTRWGSWGMLAHGCVVLRTWQEAGSACWLRVNFRLEKEKGHNAVNLKRKDLSK